MSEPGLKTTTYLFDTGQHTWHSFQTGTAVQTTSYPMGTDGQAAGSWSWKNGG